MTRAALLKLTGSELDVLIHTEIMKDSGKPRQYTRSLSNFAPVRRAIRAMRLQTLFIQTLGELVGKRSELPEEWFELVDASAQVQAVAALLTAYEDQNN